MNNENAEIKLPIPAVIAHRGASEYAPENTMNAFRLAYEQGANAIEFDVKLCGSGEIVVIHDPTLDRTTSGRGYVNQTSLKEIKKLDAGKKIGEKMIHENIPTLEEVFIELGGMIYMNIELTNYTSPTDGLVEETAKLIRKYHLENSLLLSSFNPLALIKARKLLPDIPIALLAEAGWKGSWARNLISPELLKCQALHPAYTDIEMEDIKKYHEKGYRVHTYTINSRHVIKQMISFGIDGIFTNDPLSMLYEMKRKSIGET